MAASARARPRSTVAIDPAEKAVGAETIKPTRR
jgi:hypothetical protein